MQLNVSETLTSFPELILERINKSIVSTLKTVSDIYTQKIVKETFDNKGKRDEHPEWVPLSPFTIAQKLMKHGGKYTSKHRAKSYVEKIGGIPIQKLMAERKSMPILRDTAELRGSINVISKTDNSVTIGSGLPHAKKHQFGDPNNVFRGKKASIPKREFIFITEKDNEIIVIKLQEYLQKELKKL